MENTIKSISKKKNNKEKRISIEEIENGFIITRNTEWTDKKGQWHHDTKKWHSETYFLIRQF
jgi:hypothetical protein